MKMHGRMVGSAAAQALVAGAVLLLASASRAEEPAPRVYPPPSAEEKAILEALAKPIMWEAGEFPLDSFVERLGSETGIDVTWNRQALAEDGKAPIIPFDTRRHATVRSLLDSALSQLDGAAWTIADDALLITSTDDAESRLHVRVYDVADLLDSADADPLIELITMTVEPSTWMELGGVGSIKPFISNGRCALTIRHTMRVHEQTRALLDTLRTLPANGPHADPPMPAPVYGVLMGGPQDAEDHSEPEAAQAVNTFAFELYQRLAADVTGNLAISPLGCWRTLQMIRSGARGDTAAELDKTLRIPAKAAEPNEFASSLFRHFDRENESIHLSLANALGISRRALLDPAFVAGLQRNFGTALIPFDPAQPGNAAELFNRFCADHSQGKLNRVVDSDNFDAATRLVALSTLFFQGKWEHPFEKKNTMPENFSAPNEAVLIPMMRQYAGFRTGETDQARWLRMPYRGRGYAMYVLLPIDENTSLADLEASLTASGFDQLTRSGTELRVHLRLPQWKQEINVELVPTLRQIGVRAAFSDSADLSGISAAEPLQLAEARQTAYLEIDENGTTAAAATALIGAFGEAPADAPIQFVVNRPFLFIIRDESSGVVLFIGRMMDPTPPFSGRGFSGRG